MGDSPSLKLSDSAFIDDMERVGIDSQTAHFGEIKKITMAWIPQIYNNHAHLCFFMP
jgi:hypothetical protein